MEPEAGSYKGSIINDSIVKILFITTNQIIKLTVKNKNKNKKTKILMSKN